MNNKQRIISIFLLLTLPVACVTGPAGDQAANQIAAGDSTQVDDAKNKRVCKSAPPTGTRIAKRVCKTQGAWDEMERLAQQRLDNTTKPQSNNPKGD